MLNLLTSGSDAFLGTGEKISQYWTGGRVLNKHAQIPDTIVIVVPF